MFKHFLNTVKTREITEEYCNYYKNSYFYNIFIGPPAIKFFLFI